MKLKFLSRQEWADLIFLSALLLGTFIRFNPTLLSGFAISQGGMFAVMVDDLRANHYLLPAFTTYNHLQIPFAYPPLGFYIGAFTAGLFSIDSLQVVRWLPPFFSSLSIAAFYFLAQRILKSKYHASIATLLFAFLPRAFSWYITGSGLTRSPGQFFLLLTLLMTVKLFQENRQRDMFWAGTFAGLTILSHPEAAIHMVASVIFLWVILVWSRDSFIHLIGIGLVAFVITSPWWWTVLHSHGIEPLLNAARTGQKSSAVLNLLFFDFTEETYATVIAVLALIGVGICLVRRAYLLPLWLAVPFLVEGRSAILPAAIPMSMLAACGFVDGVLRALSSIESFEIEKSDKVAVPEVVATGYILFYLLFSAYQFGYQLSGSSVPKPDREAMNWIENNTPTNSRFLVLTGTNSISCDMVLEWFPALTNRQSIYTVQGTEWTKGAQFTAYVQSTYAVQQCLRTGDLSCLDSLIDRAEYDFLYIDKLARENCRPVNLPNASYFMVESLQKVKSFNLVYESPEVIIFGK